MNVFNLKLRWDRGQALYCIMVLLAWTVTSFLCHFCGKVFLSNAANMALRAESTRNAMWLARFGHAFLLSALQLAVCYALVKIKSDTATSITHSRVAKIAHALATMATNVSMAMIFASSTFAIKLMEPITSALVQYLTIGTPLTPVTIFSLPVIVGGAMVFAGNPLAYANAFVGTVAALVSNLILAFRNIAVKQISSGPKDKAPGPILELDKPRMTLFAVSSCIGCFLALYLENIRVLPSKSTLTLAMGCSSAFFHVTYSFISTGMVLTKISVVSHAVANILKRVLVVLLLYTFGRRVVSPLSFLGLAICTAGLLAYVWDKARQKELSDGEGEFTIEEESKTRKPILPGRHLRWQQVAAGLTCLCVFAVLVLNISDHQEVLTKGKAILSRQYTFRPFMSSFSSSPPDDSHSYARDTFGVDGLRRPTDEELQPLVEELSPEVQAQVPDFLQRRLIDPDINSNSPFLSSKLTQTSEVIRESQRLHFNILGDALKGFKYAMLFIISESENKGDSCITIGEIYFLRRLNIELIYYCNFKECHEDNMEKAVALAHQYSTDELVVLASGGGNIIGYPPVDRIRFAMIKNFPEYQMIVLPQSVWRPTPNNSHVQATIRNYCCHPNLTIFFRDPVSLELAQKLFIGSSKLRLAPDMAFQIGHVNRFMSPVFDILWVKRNDRESKGYYPIKKVPKHVRVHSSDWLKSWATQDAGGNSIEKAFNFVSNGFIYLQRARVIITDRLHGHIISTLMDIPHVLIDTPSKKISGYHLAWTKSLENTVITSNPDEAFELGLRLLEKYNHTLPPRVPYLEVGEDFVMRDLEQPTKGYV